VAIVSPVHYSVARHREYKKREIDPHILPLSKADYLSVVETLGLSPDLIYMRAEAGASGYFSVVRDRGDDGRVLATGDHINPIPCRFLVSYLILVIRSCPSCTAFTDE
jgi:hypothetical protein